MLNKRQVMLAMTAIGFGAVMALGALSGCSQVTFGARCAHVYPTDALAAERCVHDLYNGRRL